MTREKNTVCAAFQATAAANPDAIALRTRGGEIEISWGEYAERVRRLAGALHRLGLRRGDTMALMLTNRPEFHLLDELEGDPETANARLSNVEKLRRHKLLDIEWEPGGDELTPTMKLKRRPIAEKYAEDIDALYKRERG